MERKRKIFINFEDMWPTFDKIDNYFYRLLSSRYDLIISDKPEYLIYGNYGARHKRYDCVKINYLSENCRPHFEDCDYAFSFDYPEKTCRNYRLPLYALYMELYSLQGHSRMRNFREQLSNEEALEILKNKERFCCMVVSNDKAKERLQFYKKLTEYKKVDSGGRVFNNIGGAVENKLEFIEKYKFIIAFENSSYPGYTTEKILDGFVSNCIPIYWGNEVVGREFDDRAFINVHNYETYEEVIERVLELDGDDELFLEYIKCQKFIGGREYINIRRENILEKFEEIFSENFYPSSGAKRRKAKVLYWRLQDTKHKAVEEIKDRFPLLRRIRI